MERRTSSREVLNLCGIKTTRSHCVFACQIAIIYIVIVACIINLSLGNGDSTLWTTLMSSSLGYVLPSPKLKVKKNDIINTTNPL